MCKRKRKKRQTIVNKTENKKLSNTNQQKDGVNSGDTWVKAVPAQLVTPVVFLVVSHIRWYIIKEERMKGLWLQQTKHISVNLWQMWLQQTKHISVNLWQMWLQQTKHISVNLWQMWLQQTKYISVNLWLQQTKHISVYMWQRHSKTATEITMATVKLCEGILNSAIAMG
jgi:hypothetical protein